MIGKRTTLIAPPYRLKWCCTWTIVSGPSEAWSTPFRTLTGYSNSFLRHTLVTVTSTAAAVEGMFPITETSRRLPRACTSSCVTWPIPQGSGG